MTSTVNLTPVGDVDNDGWIPTGAGNTQLWQSWSSTDDTQFAKSPSHKGQGIVRFPIDITSIPAGAVIVSVSLMLRSSLGSATPPAGVSASVTIAISSDDNTSTASFRTVNPTSTPTTLEVATYKKNVAGQTWDIETINGITLAAFSYQAIEDLIRVHELYAVITYATAPTITLSSPSGTVYTSSPSIAWLYRQADGDAQASSQYQIFTATQAAAPSFSPSVTTPVFAATVTGNISSVILPTSLDPNDYWVYVRSYSSFGAVSPWTGRQFTVDGPSPGTPGVADDTGAQPPGVGVVQTVTDAVSGSAILTLQDTSNMLSVQDADAETVTDGTTLTAVNCTLQRDPTQAFGTGLASWQMTSLASGNMSVVSDWIEVAPGQPVTAQAQMLADTVGRSCWVAVAFYDALFNLIAGASFTGSGVLDATSTWSSEFGTGFTPVGAALAQITWTVSNCAAAGEVHNIDQLAFSYGTNSPWSDGGHMSRNLLSAWYSTAEGTPLFGESWIPAPGSNLSQTIAAGLGASGSTCNQLTYTGVAPGVGFRAAGTVFTTPTSGTDYTLNCPIGVQAGDLMLAFVQSSSITSIVPPAGWTMVDTASAEDGTVDAAMFIMMRSATASEPSAWTDGVLGSATSERTAIVVAYSGAADQSQQFIGEATAASANNSPVFLTTPQVNNTDPNAWRVSAFGFVDDAAGGTQTANVQPSTIPPIQFVGKATVWESAAANSAVYINRPASVISGDFMVATIAISGEVTSLSLPGWTIQDHEFAPNVNLTHYVVSRFAGASEPGSWAGTVIGTYTYTQARATECSAYRNVNPTTPIQAARATISGAGSTITSGTLANTNSNAWLLGVFDCNTDGYFHGWSAGAMIQRSDDQAGVVSALDGVEIGMFDSGAPIATGNYTAKGVYAGPFYSALAWIGILNPLSSVPTPGGNDTIRATASIGVTNVLYTQVYDSNGAAAVGQQSMTGTFAPGDDDGLIDNSAGWIGIIRPAVPIIAGLASAVMAAPVDISGIDPSLMALAGSQAVLQGSFTGTTASTPLMTVNFYRANQLLSSAILPGQSYAVGIWSKSYTTVDVPDSTTRMSATLAVSNCNPGDSMFFDRVSLALGSDTAYRAGTSRPAHPIWALPQLEYADDDGSGYIPWAVLPGSLVALPPTYDPYSGLSSYVDHTCVPLLNRKYRAKTVSYGLLGDQFVSAYGPDSNEFSFVAQSWWLKDISNPVNNLLLKVKFDNVSVDKTNTAVAFQGLGASLPVVLTQGFKSDNFTLTLIPVVHADWVALYALLESGKTLFLQSDHDQAWWVRPLGDPVDDMLPTDSWKSNPVRQVKVTFIEVAAET